MSKEQILAMLPTGPDVHAPEIQQFNALISLGSSTHEALGDALLGVEHDYIAGRIIVVFDKSKGDKTIARQYLKRFLELPRGDSEPYWRYVRNQATVVLKKIESEQIPDSAQHPLNSVPILQSHSTDTAPVNPTSSVNKEESVPVMPWIIIPSLFAVVLLLLLILRKRRL